MRAFIALELPPVIKSKLMEVRYALANTGANVKWVENDNIHLTLKFLGDIDEVKIAGLKTAVKESANLWGAFRLGFGDLGAFPRRNNPRIIWVGVKPDDQLSSLQQFLEEAAYRVGVERDERKWSPHLTLGRVKYVEKNSPLITRLKSIKVETLFTGINRLTLFESRLSPEGPTYIPVESVKLA